LLRTIQHLRPIQIWYLLWYKFTSPPRVVMPKRVAFRPVGELLASFNATQPSMLSPDSFRFLNDVRSLDWNNPGYPRLWLYNLHYFDDLVSVDNRDRFEWHQLLISRWISENPVATGAGWEPYPTSRRIVNWVKWLLLGHKPVPLMLESIAQQAEYVYRRLELHLLTNHLLANVKALVFASVVLECEQSAKWFNKAQHLLAREIREQIHDDGGHCERSPMYHALILEDFMDLINISESYNKPVYPHLRAVTASMLGWLKQLSRADGSPSYLNDSVAGIAPPLPELENYGRRLGIGGVAEPLDDSGFVVLENDRVRAVMDIGSPSPSYQAGHAHAEALSIELEIAGRPIFVNRGISTYEANETRSSERSTMAHNTIGIDGQNSSETWGAFRVARRAKVSVVQRDLKAGVIRATHDGYRRLPHAVIHDRELQLLIDGVTVIDRVSGHGRHCALAYWHLHPDCEIESGTSLETGEIFISTGAGSDAARLKLTFSGQTRARVEDSRWNATFGTYLPNSLIVCEISDLVPFSFSLTVKSL